MRISGADEQTRPPPHLVITEMSAGYGGAPVVEHVSLTAGHGEIVTLLGPNGAGKSTVLKALVGLAKITAGSVRIGDADITKAPPYSLAAKGCGYVPQTRDVFEELTVLENLEMGGYLLDRRRIRSRIDEVIEVFPDLAKLLPRVARKMSGGERKMLAIARVMVSHPNLMLLDEPTANLAPMVAQRLLDVDIRAVADAGTAVLLVEQKAAVALSAADFAYLLVSGRIVRSGYPAILQAQPDFAEVFLGRR
jgi:branched-chain amino acid transport system ATP-binding protein